MNKLKKILPFVIVFSLICVFVSGCGNSSKNNSNSKEVVYGLKVPRVALDITKNTPVEAMRIPENVYEGLLQVDPETTELIPCIAESLPEISEDNLTYTFHLKPGIKFHDGTDLKASDVKYSFERILNPKTASPMAEDFTSIQGAQEYLDGKTNEVNGIEIIDDNTIRFKLNTPFALFSDYLGNTPIYPEKACSEAGGEWGVSVMVGTGPFKFESFDVDSGCRLVKFDEYHGKTPNIDSIYYRFFADRTTMMLEYEHGGLDFLLIDDPFAETYLSNEKFKSHIKRYRSYGNYCLILNLDKEPWNNKKVREAFAHAVNVPALTSELLGNYTEPAKSFIPEGTLGYDSSFRRVQYNPEKAKQLLREAGYELPLKIEMTVYSFEHNGGKMTTALQNQIQEAGFEINSVQIEPGTFRSMQDSGQIPAYIYSSTGSYEADRLLYGMFNSKNSIYLSSNYKSKEFDSLVEKARRTLNKEEREKLYNQADKKLVNEDFAVIPICDRNQFYMTQPWLKNFEIKNAIYPWKTCDIDLDLKNK